jgi:hypothetical protein
MKRLIEKIRQKRFEKKKRKYFWVEMDLRARGIEHIKYNENGVPFPDWEKIISEKIERIKQECDLG